MQIVDPALELGPSQDCVAMLRHVLRGSGRLAQQNLHVDWWCLICECMQQSGWTAASNVQAHLYGAVQC